jgi:hypothetical protein
MPSLPHVTEGLALPAEQPLVAGQRNDYVGIYVIDEEPRIVMTLSNPL